MDIMCIFICLFMAFSYLFNAVQAQRHKRKYIK